jgi:hypothetical protein
MRETHKVMTAIAVRLKKLNIIIIKNKTKTQREMLFEYFFLGCFLHIEETSLTYSASKIEFETF